MTYIHIPEKLNKLLHMQLAEVIRETERLADSDNVIMTNPEIYQYLTQHSEKLKNYEYFKTFQQYAEIANFNYNINEGDINNLCYEYQKKLFELSEDEQMISDSFFNSQDFYERYGYLSENDIYFFTKDRSCSTPNKPFGYNLPESLSNTPMYSYELKTFHIENNISDEIYPAGFVLKALTYAHTKENPIEYTSSYAAIKYLTSLLEDINYFIEDDENELGFLLKEIYHATRHYTINDIDKHLTLDIPIIPYSGDSSEIKSVYYLKPYVEDLKPEVTDIYEYLFATDSDYFSVKLKIGLPHARWFIETSVIEKNSSATVFGFDLNMTDTELSKLKGLSIKGGVIKFIDNFDMNEEKVRTFIAESYDTSQAEILRDYFLLSKNLWIPNQYQRLASYEANIDGLEEELFPQFRPHNIAIQENIARLQIEKELNEAIILNEDDGLDNDFDDFDFGNDLEEITTPPPARERLCQQCLEELGMNEIDTPAKKQNFICEWCVEKRAMAQAKVVNSNTVSEQDIKEAESVETIVIEKREFKPRVKIVFWILVVALIAIAFT